MEPMEGRAEQALVAALDNETIAAYMRHDVVMLAALLRDGMASRALLDALNAVPRSASWQHVDCEECGGTCGNAAAHYEERWGEAEARAESAEREREELRACVRRVESERDAQAEKRQRAEREFGRLHSTYLEIAEALRVNHDRTDRLREAAHKAVQGVISSGSGPAAPCFDEHDRAVERQRGKWYKVDGQAIDDLCAALNRWDGET